MTVNLADQTLDQRLLEEIKAMRRELNAIKTVQYIGGDNILYSWSGGATASGTIAANGVIAFYHDISSLVTDVPLFPLHVYTVCVGTTTMNSNRAFPGGSLLTTTERSQMRVTSAVDLLGTTTDGMTWRAVMLVCNDTASPVDFYYQGLWRFPKLVT